MASSSYILGASLTNYLLGKKSDNDVPKLIKHDPAVQYIRSETLQYECPFCWRKYNDKAHLVKHLTSDNTMCAKLFNEFVELTLQRYLLFRATNHVHLRRKLYQLKVIPNG